MTDATVTPYPETPAQLAAAILDAIEAKPEAFDMTTWFSSRGPLMPDEEPDCCTTMCIAGWAAHLSGWTLDESCAVKPGARRWIEDAAADALGHDLVNTTNLFWLPPDDALEVLRELAGR
ncbi:hypothetical protein ACF1AX_31280 [Streptomyces sp. NPDC014802]|uniref:hypothetical protein n=1 Tax=Streptomyces sp. NPDC014802 TaxID=3364917 RepID=UPI0036F853B5